MHSEPIPGSSASHPPFRAVLPWLFFITASFFLNFVARTIFSPLLVPLEHDLHINHAQAGRFFLDMSLGYGISLLLSGFLSCRVSHRVIIALTPLCMGATLFGMAACHSLLPFELLLVAFGLSIGIYLPSGVAAVVSLVSPKNVGKAIAIHELAPNLSYIMGPLLAELFLRFTSWRGALVWLGAISMAFSLVFLRFGRGGNFLADKPSFSLAREFVSQPMFWIMLFLFAIAIGASFGPYSVMPLFLVNERGYDSSLANQLLALSRLLGPLVVFATGWLTDTIGPKPTMALFTVLAGFATLLLGVLHGGWLVAAILLQPPLTVLFFSAGFTAISRIYPKKMGSLAVAFIIPAGIVLGNGLVPAALGYMGKNHTFAQGFILVGILTLIGFPCLRFLSVPPAGDDRE